MENMTECWCQMRNGKAGIAGSSLTIAIYSWSGEYLADATNPAAKGFEPT
jgi:hypothetical protein